MGENAEPVGTERDDLIPRRKVAGGKSVEALSEFGRTNRVRIDVV
jgi:hypothetical protein